MSKAWDIKQLEQITESKDLSELRIIKEGIRKKLAFLKIKLGGTKDEKTRQVLKKQITELEENFRIVGKYLALFQNVSPDQVVSFETKN